MSECGGNGEAAANSTDDGVVPAARCDAARTPRSVNALIIKLSLQQQLVPLLIGETRSS